MNGSPSGPNLRTPYVLSGTTVILVLERVVRRPGAAAGDNTGERTCSAAAAAAAARDAAVEARVRRLAGEEVTDAAVEAGGSWKVTLFAALLVTRPLRPRLFGELST